MAFIMRSLALVTAIIYLIEIEANRQILTKNMTGFDVDYLRRKFGGDLPTAICDVVEGFPITELAIAFDNHTGR